MKPNVDKMEIKIKDGWQLNPNENIVKAIERGVLRNNGECPCANDGVTREERLCPCKSYLEKDKCCCNLYVKL